MMSRQTNPSGKHKTWIIALAALAVLLVIGGELYILNRAHTGPAASSSGADIGSLEGAEFVDQNGDPLDEDLVGQMEDGTLPEDFSAQVVQPEDYVEPGEGALDIDSIQGFSAQQDLSGGDHKNEDAQTGEPVGSTDGNADSGKNTDSDSGKNTQDDSGNQGNGDAGNNSDSGNQQEQPKGIILSDSNLTIEALGSYTGNFLEDGSDEPVADVASILITNHGDQMLQVAQITFQVNESQTAVFQVTDLPVGASALVLEQNRRTYSADDDYSYGDTVTAYIDGPYLESDKFDITMSDGKVTLTNKTDTSYEKVYIYYKYVQLGGAYKGGITYRTPVENIPANGSAEAVAGHMNSASTRIVDVRIVN